MALCNLPSLVEQSFAGYRIPEHGAKHVIRDVLSGLDYAYNDCNIIYTGRPFVFFFPSRASINICIDVKITNVVTTVPQDALPKEGLGHSNLCPAAHVSRYRWYTSHDNREPQLFPNLIQRRGVSLASS